MKKIVLIVVSFSTLVLSMQINARTIDCKLDTRLTKDQISAITKAKKLTRSGLNSSILGSYVYRIEILNNKKSNQLLVMLGETHIKGAKSSAIGKEMLKQFSVRITEGIPLEEAAELKKNYPEVYAEIGWKRTVLSYVLFNPFGSTIKDAEKQGKVFEIKELTDAVKNRNSNNDYTEQGVKNIRNLVASAGNRYLNINMEFGDFINPSDSESYIINDRNIRMAKNISIITKATSEKGPQLVIVGSDHVFTIAGLLSYPSYEYNSEQESENDIIKNEIKYEFDICNFN